LRRPLRRKRGWSDPKLNVEDGICDSERAGDSYRLPCGIGFHIYTRPGGLASDQLESVVRAAIGGIREVLIGPEILDALGDFNASDKKHCFPRDDAGKGEVMQVNGREEYSRRYRRRPISLAQSPFFLKLNPGSGKAADCGLPG
jgi:hypothetical protein